METLEAINEQTISEPLRPYLGMSLIGTECERFIWYSFRWCYENKINSRTNRILRRGDSEEQIVIKQLESVGITVFGTQYEVSACSGHTRGHFDGKMYGLIEDPKNMYILEIKTMRDKYFQKVKKSNIKIERPLYYAQVQFYMHRDGVHKTYFVIVNKDTDEWYVERIDYDKEYAEKLEIKANQIIGTNIAPDRRPKYTRNFYLCKNYPCRAYEVCHNDEPVQKNCRTCAHSGVYDNGMWACTLHEMELAEEQQRLGCNKYLVLPSLEV